MYGLGRKWFYMALCLQLLCLLYAYIYKDIIITCVAVITTAVGIYLVQYDQKVIEQLFGLLEEDEE